VISGEVPSSGYARRLPELAVYRKSRLLAKEVFQVSKGFPREETFPLTDQLRGASRSMGAQTADDPLHESSIDNRVQDDPSALTDD
jgi:hypothetical protein